MSAKSLLKEQVNQEQHSIFHAEKSESRKSQGWISDMEIYGPTSATKSGYFLLIWLMVCLRSWLFLSFLANFKSWLFVLVSGYFGCCIVILLSKYCLEGRFFHSEKGT